MEQDDILGAAECRASLRALLSAAGVGRQQVGKAQPGQSETACPEHFTSRDAAAQGTWRTKNSQHSAVPYNGLGRELSETSVKKHALGRLPQHPFLVLSGKKVEAVSHQAD